ncbi:MAG: hypothetical protein ACOY4D_12410 [Pseudomonadota bacterium]
MFKPKTEKHAPPPSLEKPVEWGKTDDDNFGYVDEAERLKKRGLEDWELVEKIPESQHNIPYWFIAIFVALLLIAVGLNFPFWGDRPGYEREWFNWGLPLGVVYTTIAVIVIYWLADYRHIRRGKKAAQQENKAHSQEQDT